MRWTKCPRCNKLPRNHYLLLQYKLLPQTLCVAIGRVYHQQWRVAFFIYYHKQWFIAFSINYHQQWVIVFSIYYQQQCFVAFSIYYHEQWFVAFSIYCSQQWFIAFPIYYHQQMNVAIVTLATKFVTLQDFYDQWSILYGDTAIFPCNYWVAIKLSCDRFIRCSIVILQPRVWS